MPRAWATHGGEDVPVFAIGPLSTLLFSGSIDQSYIPHAISYAACLETRHASRCSTNSAGGTPINVNDTISSISCPSAEPNSAAISSDVMNDQARNSQSTTAKSVASYRLPLFTNFTLDSLLFFLIINFSLDCDRPIRLLAGLLLRWLLPTSLLPTSLSISTNT